jgi:hypothetical protein
MDPASTFVVLKPENPVGWTWLAATILREQRGDGHVLAGVFDSATAATFRLGGLNRPRHNL